MNCSPSRFYVRSSAAARAFSLIEILVVVIVITILALMVFESYQSFLARAERVRCTSNLRSLHVALATYTKDQEHWPQCPFEIGDTQFDKWWMREMSRYNLGRTNWECPSYKRLQREGALEKEKDDEKLINYVPTPFDDGARTPFKWPTQPWAVEMGDFHGDGNLVLFPDGSIKGFNQFAAGQR